MAKKAMIKLFVILLAMMGCNWFAAAQASERIPMPEKAQMVEALYRAAIALPQDKRKRAERAIADFDDGSHETGADYGWSKAEPLLMNGGVDALIQAARQSGGPLRYARTDALLSAGVRLRLTDPEAATRINAALLELAGRADTFELMIYAHAAAELAAIRCDAAMFRSATLKTGLSDSLRYAFWRGRFEGDLTTQIKRVWEESSSEDTRHIRQAIDGYRLIDQYGYCATSTLAVVD